MVSSGKPQGVYNTLVAAQQAAAADAKQKDGQLSIQRQQ